MEIPSSRSVHNNSCLGDAVSPGKAGPRLFLALHRGNGFVGKLIRWQSRSCYSHSALVFIAPGAKPKVIEAREFVGVRCVDRIIAEPGTEIDWFEIPVKRNQYYKILDFAEAQVGKPYDYLMVLRFISRRRESRSTAEKWFCSEHSFASCRHGHIYLLARTEPWEASPGLLGRSPVIIPTGVPMEMLLGNSTEGNPACGRNEEVLLPGVRELVKASTQQRPTSIQNLLTSVPTILKIMKKIKLLPCLALAALALGFTGCVVVPKTVIAGYSESGRLLWKVSAPKDVVLKGLSVKKETDGSASVKLESYEAHMNPRVIDSSARGQVEIVKEYRGLLNDMAGHAKGTMLPPMP